MKFHTNLVFAFFMRFEVNIQGEKEGGERDGGMGGTSRQSPVRVLFCTTVPARNHHT